jgi:hypothetical protein
MSAIFDLFSSIFQNFCEIKKINDSRKDISKFSNELVILCYKNSEFFDPNKQYLNIVKRINIPGHEKIPFYLRNEEKVNINTKFGVLIKPIKETLASWNDAVAKGYINEVSLFNSVPIESQECYLSQKLLLEQMCYIGVGVSGCLNILKKDSILKKENSLSSLGSVIYTRKSLSGNFGLF